MTKVLLTLGLAARIALVRRAAPAPTIMNLVRPDSLSTGPTAKATKIPAIADLQHNYTDVVPVTGMGFIDKSDRGSGAGFVREISGRTPEAALSLMKIVERLTGSSRFS